MTVIVLLNVLIGIVCSSYDDSINNGERAFWINRLKLIDEIDVIKEMLENGFAKIQRKLCLQTSKKEIPNLYHQSEHVDQGHVVWDLLTIAFEDMKFNRKRRMDIVHKFEASGRHIFIEEKMRSKDSRPIITCLIGLVVIPLWFILGVVTFGLLWPLQVRAAIFCPKIIVASTELSSDRFSNTIVMKRVSDQREEKVDFSPSKVFSSLTKEEELFNKINSLEIDSRSMQEAVDSMKDDIDGLRKDLKDDMDRLRKDVALIVDIMKQKVKG